MIKQERIQEAYGEYWETVKDFVNENGWCSVRRRVGFDEIISKLSWETRIGNQYCWRPKSLQGIENNNGWIKIESEDDLPKEERSYWVVDSENNIVEMEYFLKYKSFTEEEVSHYQPIQKPNPPLY